MTRPTALGLAIAFVRRSAGAIGNVVRPWRARIARGQRSTVRLDEVRRRLELLVTAVYDRPIPITVAEPTRSRVWSRWTDPFGPRHLQRTESLATTDGERIQLPREVAAGDAATALAEYRLMALEQAERIVRGTVSRVTAAATHVERDLYLAREAELIDAAIARAVPGLRSTLAAARERALDARPSTSALTRTERAVEEVVRESLSVDLTSRTRRVGLTGPAESPDESLAWARQKARELLREGGRYRGIAPVAPWGLVRAWSQLPHERLERADELATFQGTKYGIGKFGHGSGKGGRQSSETGQHEGTSTAKRDGPLIAHVDGTRPMPASGGQGAAAGSDEALDSNDAAPDASDTGVDQTKAPLQRDEVAGVRRRPSRVPEPKSVGSAVEYPEWDWQAGDYVRGALVHSREPDVSDDSWGNAVLARYGPLVRRLRERFERLRARRVRLNQQRDGDELDLAACVRALVDQRSGHPPDDRLYLAVRPARRGLAICLLIDISGSTDEWIDLKRRVIDVEKVALLLASEALDALGDLYGILAFSGKGRGNVRMRTIKGFAEANGTLVRARIAALEPEGYTRAGAAIRHAAALLERQPAAHRLLLMISDGKPNDVDGYDGLYGVEDTRQAIHEARAHGVYPFCLTIDRQGQEYLGRIFGESGHTVLRNPSQLPVALVKVVKHLLAS